MEDTYGSRAALRQRAATPEMGPTTAGRFQPGRHPIGFLAARKTFYAKKHFSGKLGFCCVALAPPIIIISLIIALIPVVWAIGMHTLNTAKIQVYSANITGITNTSFPISLDGQVKKTGIFPARAFFRESVEVYWMTPPPAMEEKHLGSMNLSALGIAAGHARLRQATTFQVRDEEAFGQFAEFLVSQEEFTWKLNTSNVHVKAFGFLPTFKNLGFSKHVVLKGMANFTDIKILDFQLPGDAPEGGISLGVKTALTNPSPFGVEIGSLNLDLFYQGLYLGPGQATNLNITPGVNVIQVDGRLIPHNDNQTALGQLGKLFTAYLNNEVVPAEAHGVSTTMANGETISWLSRGIKALNIKVPIQAPQAINPIQGIDINYLGLVYNKTEPWSPEVFSNALKAQIALPFGFSLDIVETSNTITLQYNNNTIGTIAGATSNSSTKLDLISAGQTAGTIDITLPISKLQLANDSVQAEQQLVIFQDAFTYSDGTGFDLQGTSSALTNTPIGQVLLDGIKFQVPSGLRGLDGLTKYPTVISSVDVINGTTEGLELSVQTSIINPSNLNLSVGDTSFQLWREVLLGTVTLPNLNLQIGPNNLTARSMLDPNRAEQGKDLLNRFISGQATSLNITGFDNSSDIISLAPTLKGLHLNATLPGLQDKLISYANLSVLDTTGITNDIANGLVGLNNPFTSKLRLTHIRSNVSSHGIHVADIDTDLNFLANGKSVTGSPPIPILLNLNPPDIFALLRALVVQSGQDVAPLDAIVNLAGYKLSATTDANNGPRPSRRSADEETAADLSENGPSFIREEENDLAHMLMDVRSNPGIVSEFEEERDVADEDDVDAEIRSVAGLAKRGLFTGFDLPSYVQRAFSVATANVQADATVYVGDYPTNLSLSQLDVPLNTDASLNKLLPVLAGPIVQKLVEQAVLNIDTVIINDPQETEFGTTLTGSITNAGPFDADISFPEGLTVIWEGRTLGQIGLPSIAVVGDVGGSLNQNANFRVTDQGAIADFAKVLLTTESFVWQIQAQNVSVKALGITIDGISLTKQVQLRGFNGLIGAVSINSFDLPSNDPAGGIHLDVQSTIRNPSQVGISLSRFGINVFTGDNVFLGPQAAAAPFTLAPGGSSALTLSGRLIPQTTPEGQQTLSNLFSDVVHGKSPSLLVKGDYAGPASVTWLNEAIKVLSIPVSLPAQNFDVINAITLNQFSLFFTQPTTWAPETSSSLITAGFFLPFAFPIDITSVSGRFVDNYLNTDVGVLNIPTLPAKTDVQSRIISLAYNDIPLIVPDGSHSQFSQFVADATRQSRIDFNLHGTATASASTAAGPVTISDLDFSVGSSLAGVQNLNARPAEVSNLDVTRGFPDYLLLSLTTTLFNPSNLTVGTGDVTFNTVYKGQVIGQVVINDLVLRPGVNVVPTQLRFDPQGGAAISAGREVLENYVANLTSTVSVAGSRDSTPIASLKQAISGISLDAAVPALNKLLIIATKLTIPADVAQTSTALVSFTLDNPFTASINLFKLQATASYDGIVLGTINTSPNPPIRAPGHQQVTSDELPFQLTKNLNDLVKFIIVAGQNTGTDLGPLPGLLGQLNGATTYNGKVTSGPDTGNNGQCASGGGFDINNAILSLLKGLRTDVTVNTDLALDDYRTSLSFTQKNTPTTTDETALRLIGLVAPPIVQQIVDQTQLSFNLANATDLTDEGFTVSLQGSVSDSGPFDAFIEFTEPLTVNWKGSNIATIQLPGICAQANKGVPDYRSTGTLKITDQSKFADFATSILHTESFTWTVSTDKLRVHALGLQFDNVNLTKSVSFSAFNDLPGVTIKDFTIPGQTGDSLLIATTSIIPSKAALGIELGKANFDIRYLTTDVGSVTADNLFLAPKTDNSVALNGEIQSQSGDDLKNIGKLFSGFLAGKDQALTIKGVSVISPAQPGSPVKWLTAAFKSLNLNVTLPGRRFNVITDIAIADLEVDITGPTDQSYTLPASSKSTVATFANPFNFSLTPIQASTDIIINYQGVDTARLDLGNIDTAGAGTSTGPNDPGRLNLAFENKDIVAIDRGSFRAFLAQLTDKAEGSFTLAGTADVVGRTVIGDVPISGIPVNTNTTLKGIDSFGGKAPISNLDVAGSTSDAINIDITVELNNPSNLTVKTKEVSLPSFYSGTEVGRTIIDTLDLQPGNNTVKAVFSYSPSSADAEKASELLTKYLQPLNGDTEPQSATIDVHGFPGANPPSTPYESLEDAINGISISSTVKGLGARIVTGADITLQMENLFRGPKGRPQAGTTITAQNVLPVAINLQHIKSAVSAPDLGGTVNTLVRLDTDLKLLIPASPATGVKGQAVTSSEISPVNVDAPILSVDGGGQATDLLLGSFNLDNVITATLDGGYTLDGLKYVENNVPAAVKLTYKGEVLASDSEALLGATVGFFQTANVEQANDVLGYLTNDTLAIMKDSDNIFNIFTSPAAEGTSALCKATDLPLDVRQHWDPSCQADASARVSGTTSANSTTSTASTASPSTTASLPTTEAPASPSSSAEASASEAAPSSTKKATTAKPSSTSKTEPAAETERQSAKTTSTSTSA